MPRAKIDERWRKLFGRRLRALRQATGRFPTQASLAAAIKSSDGAISQLETGKRAPSLGRAIQLADALGLPLADLFAVEPGPRRDALDAIRTGDAVAFAAVGEKLEARRGHR